MAKAYETNSMGNHMGRSPALNEYGQIANIAFTPKVRTATADTTLVASQSGSIFSNVGMTAAVNYTLPAIADGPFWFMFINGADQDMTVTAETADTMITFNDLAADSVAFSTASEQIGGAFMVICDGTSLFAIPMGAGGHVQTLTVATA